MLLIPLGTELYTDCPVRIIYRETFIINIYESLTLTV